MNTSFNVFAKDLRRTRFLFGFWVILVIARFALMGWKTQSSSLAAQFILQTFPLLLALITGLMVLILVVVVVQEDGLTGTTSFWFTRPISRRELLKAKVIYGLLLLGIPLLIQTVVLGYCGVTAKDNLLAVVQTLLNSPGWLLTIAVLAACTSSFGQFIIFATSIMATFGIATTLLSYFKILTAVTQGGLPIESLVASRAIVEQVITLLCGVGLVLNQYLTRRTRLTLILFGLSLVLQTSLAQFWPWDFLKRPLPQLSVSGIDPAKIKIFTVDNIFSNDSASLLGGTQRNRNYSSRLNLDGIPSTFIIHIPKIDPTLKDPNGASIPVKPGSNLGSQGVRSDTESLQAAIGDIPIINPKTSYSTFNLLSIAEDDYRKNIGKSLKYSAKVHLIAEKYMIAASMPATRGAEIIHGSNRIKITDLLYDPNGVTLQLRRQSVKLLFKPNQLASSGNNPFDNKEQFVLVNRARKEAVLSDESAFNVNMGAASLEILSIQENSPHFGKDRNDSEGYFPVLDQQWMKGAELLVLKSKPVTELDAVLEIPKFSLDPGTGVTHSSVQNFDLKLASLEDLEKIHLPPNPTRKQVGDYVDEIIKVSNHQMSYSDHDPQVQMLSLVGAENVDLLISKARTYHNYYLNYAVSQLVTEDHKEMILEELADNPGLIGAVTRLHWMKEAQPILLANFINSQNNVNTEWITPLVSLKDPATYQVLREGFLKQSYGFFYQELKKLPDFDLHGAVQEAWAHADANAKRNLIESAADQGIIQALESSAKTISKKNMNTYEVQQARRVFQKHTTAPGKTDADFVKWYDQNKAVIIFDPASRKFTLPTPVANPTPSQTPVSTTNTSTIPAPTNLPPAIPVVTPSATP